MGLLLILLGYLSGSILFGKIVAHLKGVDLRKVGSGNVGATNTARALGKKYGALVFFLDMLKGYVPTEIAVGIYGYDSFTTAGVGLACVLGHMFSVFDNFKGGKGVATAFGVLLALSPFVALLSLLIWVFVLRWKGYVSLASMVSAGLSPLLIALSGMPLEIFLMALSIALLIIYKHKDNIERLTKGEEPKVFGGG